MQTNSLPTKFSAGAPVFDAARVSVIIPAYNAGDYLAATLESVFAQSALPGEVIVVDDGSSDDTVAVARTFDVKVISLSNQGPSAARNAGTLAAHGDYVAYLDADDIWRPEKLEVQLAALASYAFPAFSFTDYRVFDELGLRPQRSSLCRHPAFRKTVGDTRGRINILIAADDRRPVLGDMYFLPSSVIVRREDVIAVGGYDETLRQCEDYEFFLRLFKRVPAIAVMEPLLLYRRHETQASNAPIAMTRGLFEVERRVIGASDRYPVADARYIATKGSLLHHRLGVWYARIGQFDEAIDSFEQSLAARRTLRTRYALVAVRLGRSAPGRFTFDIVRALWKSRPKRRCSSKLAFQKPR